MLDCSLFHYARNLSKCPQDSAIIQLRFYLKNYGEIFIALNINIINIMQTSSE